MLQYTRIGSSRVHFVSGRGSDDEFAQELRHSERGRENGKFFRDEFLPGVRRQDGGEAKVCGGKRQQLRPRLRGALGPSPRARESLDT